MNFPTASKFVFSVKSTTARPPKTLEPELAIIAGIKGKFKMNEAASKLIGLKPADYLAFINNEDQLEAIKLGYAENDAECVAFVEEAGGLDKLETQWAIVKGWEMLDASGNPLTTKKPLTNVEVEQYIKAGKVDEDGKALAPEVSAYKGSRLASKTQEVRTGVTLEGADSTNCPALRQGYDDKMHVVYSVSKEGVPVQFPNGTGVVDVIAYPITFVRLDEKIEKNRS